METAQCIHIKEKTCLPGSRAGEHRRASSWSSLVVDAKLRVISIQKGPVFIPPNWHRAHPVEYRENVENGSGPPNFIKMYCSIGLATASVPRSAVEKYICVTTAKTINFHIALSKIFGVVLDVVSCTSACPKH
jgi:hypothetical protein